MKPKAATTRPAAADAAQPLITGSSRQSRRYRVRIRTAHSEYEGLFFSPYPERRLNEALARVEEFLNLKDAKDLVTGEKFPFVVIGKASIETVKIVEESA